MRRSTVLSEPSPSVSIPCFRIRNIDGLDVMGEPQVCIVAFTSTKFSVYSLADKMKEKGWLLVSIFLLFFVDDARGAPPGTRMLVARYWVCPHLYWCATSPHYMSTSKLGPAYAVIPHCTSYTTKSPTLKTNDLGLNQGSLTEGEGSVQLTSLS
jgi:hypothetical protein